MAQPKGNTVLYEFLSISWKSLQNQNPLSQYPIFPAGATSDGRNCKKTLCILTSDFIKCFSLTRDNSKSDIKLKKSQRSLT